MSDDEALAKRQVETLAAVIRVRASKDWFPHGASFSKVALDRLGEGPITVREPARPHLEEVRDRLFISFARGSGAAALQRNDLRDAPWVMWSGSPRAIDFKGLSDAVVAWAAVHRRTLRTLAFVWLSTFEAGSSHADLGAAIIRLVATSEDRRLDRWRRSRQLLFDGQSGPSMLAQKLWAGPSTSNEILQQIGLDDPILAAGGFLCAAQREILKLWHNLSLGAARKTQECLDRAFAFMAPSVNLRFGAERSRMAAGLLAPWLDSREPDWSLRTTVQNFLIEHLGDPRLKPQNWSSVGERESSLVKGWLARASLETFFRLIGEHGHDLQWRYREAFWLACLKKGAITDAWLALGSSIHASASAAKELGKAFGRLHSGVQADHAVLLFRIGPLVLCEWSHNGKLRAWRSDWGHAPKLGGSRYTKRELTTNSLPFPLVYASTGRADDQGLMHLGSENGRWQTRAAELLRERAGVDVKPSDWQPR